MKCWPVVSRVLARVKVIDCGVCRPAFLGTCHLILVDTSRAIAWSVEELQAWELDDVCPSQRILRQGLEERRTGRWLPSERVTLDAWGEGSGPLRSRVRVSLSVFGFRVGPWSRFVFGWREDRRLGGPSSVSG